MASRDLRQNSLPLSMLTARCVARDFFVSGLSVILAAVVIFRLEPCRSEVLGKAISQSGNGAGGG